MCEAGKFKRLICFLHQLPKQRILKEITRFLKNPKKITKYYFKVSRNLKGINKNQKISKYFKRFKTFQKILKDLKGTSQKIAKIPTERFQKNLRYSSQKILSHSAIQRDKRQKNKNIETLFQEHG